MKKNQEIILKLCSLVSRDWLARFASNLGVDSPSLGVSLQQIWLNSGKRSRSYIGVKITFFVFLSIYSRGGVAASWAA